ncbi:MAG: helix-hairpin-helix domain-containing protein [Deltaproteobacteria bacterium]|nr:helix-hairpin-helix domain-containing protein [Deltaproteobacteria bacterium]
MRAHHPICAMACGLALCLLPLAVAAQTVNINTATEEELQTLPGVGAKLASEIVRDRNDRGAFQSIEDLERVSGMSASVLAKIRSRLTVGSDSALVVRPGATITSSQVRAALKPYAAEPTIREIQQAAIDYARAHPERIDSWRARAANRAFAPEIETRVTKDWDKTTRVMQVAGNPDQNATYDYDNWQLMVRGRWDLDRAVFDPEEPKVAREGIRLQRYRDDVLNEVTRRYYERRRLQLELDLAPPTEMGDRVRKELRLQELTADIDALTGGYFSQKLKEIGRDPY